MDGWITFAQPPQKNLKPTSVWLTTKNKVTSKIKTNETNILKDRQTTAYISLMQPPHILFHSNLTLSQSLGGEEFVIQMGG